MTVRKLGTQLIFVPDHEDEELLTEFRYFNGDTDDVGTGTNQGHDRGCATDRHTQQGARVGGGDRLRRGRSGLRGGCAGVSRADIE